MQPRYKRNTTALGMQSVVGIEDPATAAAIQQVQAAITDLAGKVGSMQPASSGEAQNVSIVGRKGIRVRRVGDKWMLENTGTTTVEQTVTASDVEIVATLPDVPSDGKLEVYWGSSSTISGGTGDDRMWSAYAGQGDWYPSQVFESEATSVDIVAALPAIPASGMLEVMWGSSSTISGGTGDNQVWRAYAGQSLWYPTQFITSKSGAVV